jgi:thiosulfate reductase cytochrome b subunit
VALERVARKALQVALERVARNTQPNRIIENSTHNQIDSVRGQIPSAQARKALHVALERVARKALQVALERVARNMLAWLLVCTSLQLTLAQEPTASWRPNFTPLGLFCYKGEHDWLCCLISF